MDNIGKSLCKGDFSFLPMPQVSSVKNQSKLPKSLLVGDQFLDRVVFCLKPFDLNDFSWKLTKYLFPYSYFCGKNLKSSFPRKLKSCICNISLPRALHNLVAVDQIVNKNPLRIVNLSLISIHQTLNKFSIQFN